MKEGIQVRNVTKTYGRKKVVNSISFSVMKSHICAFLGPNGAGKSTTMNMLATLLAPTSGEILLEGFHMDTEREGIKRAIGVVFQEDVLDQELTVYENLYYRGGLYCDNTLQLKKRMEDVVELLSLSTLLDKKYSTCSGGQRRLVQISRALMSKPKVLLLDEPTIGLDPLAREEVWSGLKNINHKLGMTIFYTTHYMEEIAYADDICIIKDGRILLCSEKYKVIQSHKEEGRIGIQEIYRKVLKEDSGR